MECIVNRILVQSSTIISLLSLTMALYTIKYLSDGTGTMNKGRLNIPCIMFKLIAFFMITLFARLYERVWILLTYGKHLHDHIISLRVEVWVHKTRLAPPSSIEVSVPSKEHGWSCTCVLGISILALWLFDIFVVHFMSQHVDSKYTWSGNISNFVATIKLENELSKICSPIRIWVGTN